MLSTRAAFGVFILGCILSAILAFGLWRSQSPTRYPLPASCHYQRVTCIKAPCNPVLVCDDTPTPPLSPSTLKAALPFSFTPPSIWEPSADASRYVSPEGDRAMTITTFSPPLQGVSYCEAYSTDTARCEWLTLSNGTSIFIDWGPRNASTYFAQLGQINDDNYAFSLESTAGTAMPQPSASKSLFRAVVKSLKFSAPFAPNPTPKTSTSCQVGGCSGQLCSEPGESGMSTCEYRATYACYKSAICERQTTGKCGWTQTPELTRCLQSPPPLE